MKVKILKCDRQSKWYSVPEEIEIPESMRKVFTSTLNMNHQQSLDTINERGGLSLAELCACLGGFRTRDMLGYNPDYYLERLNNGGLIP